MAAEIALRPNDDRGREILDMLEEFADLEGRTEMRPTDILGDGTRRYHLDTEAFELAGEDSTVHLDIVDDQYMQPGQPAGQAGWAACADRRRC